MMKIQTVQDKMTNWLGIGISFAIGVLIWAIMTQVPSQTEIGSKVAVETSKNTPAEPYTNTANALIETKGNTESGIGSIIIKFFTNNPILFLIVFGIIGVGVFAYQNK